jgi:hypothetical protein
MGIPKIRWRNQQEVQSGWNGPIFSYLAFDDENGFGLQERTDIIILLCGHDGWTHRLNAVTHSAVGNRLAFKETDSAVDKPRSGRPRTSRNCHREKCGGSPIKSERRTNSEIEVPRGTICNILKEEILHPHKLQLLHHLTEEAPGWRVEACECLLGNKLKLQFSAKPGSR